MATNPYFAALGREPRSGKASPSKSHKRAPEQEKEMAKRLGGRTTLASGAKDEKGDVRIRGIARIECKTTKHKSFSVTLDMIRKIEEAALGAGEMPALVVEFNDNGKKIAEVAVVPMYVLDELARKG